MKKAALFLLIGITTAVLAGCASSQQASNDDGKVRTAYTVPADDSSRSSESTVWSLSPATEP